MTDEADRLLEGVEEFDLKILCVQPGLKDRRLFDAIEATLRTLVGGARLIDSRMHWRCRRKGYAMTWKILTKRGRPVGPAAIMELLGQSPEFGVYNCSYAREERAIPNHSPNVTCECRDCGQRQQKRVTTVMNKNVRCPACGGGCDVIPEHMGRLSRVRTAQHA